MDRRFRCTGRGRPHSLSQGFVRFWVRCLLACRDIAAKADCGYFENLHVLLHLACLSRIDRIDCVYRRAQPGIFPPGRDSLGDASPLFFRLVSSCSRFPPDPRCSACADRLTFGVRDAERLRGEQASIAWCVFVPHRVGARSCNRLVQQCRNRRNVWSGAGDFFVAAGSGSGMAACLIDCICIFDCPTVRNAICRHINRVVGGGALLGVDR